MADINIYEDSGRSIFDILGDDVPASGLRLMRAAIDDIADRIEEEARENIPVDEGDLKADPNAIIRRDYKRRVRVGGNLVTKTEFTIPKRGKARWVHDGTGLFGPRGRLITPRTQPFMVFEAYGRKWRLKFVRGQEAQPYLGEAFDEIEATYIPVRLAELRAELETLT
jgi:hypothetical protein